MCATLQKIHFYRKNLLFFVAFVDNSCNNFDKPEIHFLNCFVNYLGYNLKAAFSKVFNAIIQKLNFRSIICNYNTLLTTIVEYGNKFA